MLHHATSRRENEEYGEQILSKAVKAGRRTYFFDVRATRAVDYFLTITESRRGIDRCNRFHPPQQTRFF